ncbi:hypothetical protein KFE25_002509 [Diacronema lutheri]|uniref:Heterokaryon incompatibility domain-containing protein n=1 Tax=Diacronema lutheri TaxID=2081491 RepID=A0A8J5X9K3_DIALT|nr:hypothetical protein KFE25_002509 [Diacronema lutheri]
MADTDGAVSAADIAPRGVSAAWLLRFFFAGSADDHEALRGTVGSDATLRGECGSWGVWYLDGAYGREGVTFATERGHSENRGKRAVLGYREDAMQSAYLRHLGQPTHDSYVARGYDGWIAQHEADGSVDEPLPPCPTTADVVARIVVPATSEARGAYVDVLPGDIGPATHFCSHAWSSPFVCLVEALISHQLGEMANTARKHWSVPRILAALERAPNRHFYWIDALCTSQHTAAPPDLAHFQAAMRAGGRLVLCLHPWPHPLALLRCWCLFELMCAATYRLEIAVSPSHSMFRLLCEQLFEANVISMDDADQRRRAAMRAEICEQIDVRHARATVPSDVDLIFSALAAMPGGTDAVNGVVRSAIAAQLRVLHDSFVESGGGVKKRTQLRASSATIGASAPAPDGDTRAGTAAAPVPPRRRCHFRGCTSSACAALLRWLAAAKARLLRCCCGGCARCHRRAPVGAVSAPHARMM